MLSLIHERLDTARAYRTRLCEIPWPGLDFFSTKHDIKGESSHIKLIGEDILTREASLEIVLVSSKMSWAASRQTTRTSDRAYFLLGICGINMPLSSKHHCICLSFTRKKVRQYLIRIINRSSWNGMSRETERLYIFCFIDTTSKVATDCSPDRAKQAKQACSACVNY